MTTFFDNLLTFTQQKLALFNSLTQPTTSPSTQDELTDRKALLNQISLHVQSRLQFLSFVYSSLGSPRDFQLTHNHVDTLWDCLIQFNDPDTISMVSVRDDLFNWFLAQARVKDQHAISIDTFKYIFTDKIPHLDPNHFSQTALHLYQELFKIYKYSYQQAQSSITPAESCHYRQIELAAIEYIWKLAFKSSQKDVSLAAVQFLNSHYVQADTIASTDSEAQFIDSCMDYLNEACQKLQTSAAVDGAEAAFSVIERGLLLLKSHLDAFQARHSFQLRQWQLKANVSDDADGKEAEEDRLGSHAKRLEQVRIGNNEAFSSLFRRLNVVVNSLVDRRQESAMVEHKKSVKNK